LATYRIHSYKGIGRLPKGLKARSDPQKRILLDQLPRLLEGYKRTPGTDAVVVVVDSDRRECKEFLEELKNIAHAKGMSESTMFRLAIEEMEAWYLGDQEAILTAFPKAKREVLARYQQDSVCGTWELLADALHPGGSVAAPFPISGQLKHEWAEKIGPLLKLWGNASPSFQRFLDGLLKLVSK